MILQRIGIKQLRAGTVAEHKTVRRRTVMVGCRKSLIMQSAGAARRKNDGFRLGNKKLFRFHIHEHGTGAFAVLIENQLDCRRKIHDRNAAIEHLVAQGTHDLGAGIVLCGVHSLAGGSAAVRRNHRAVRRLVELHAELVEPLNGLRRFAHQLIEKLRLRGEMSAAESVEIVDRR